MSNGASFKPEPHLQQSRQAAQRQHGAELKWGATSCLFPGCHHRVEPGNFMCTKHWPLVAAPVRKAVLLEKKRLEKLGQRKASEQMNALVQLMISAAVEAASLASSPHLNPPSEGTAP